MSRLETLVAQAKRLRARIWLPASEGRTRLKEFGVALLRVCDVTLSGFAENRIVNRAAALSFSSLLGLGPLIALVMLVSGFALEQTDPEMAVEAINRAIEFIAPQLQSYGEIAGEGGEQGAQSVQLQRLLEQFIEGSRSGAVGVAGVLLLIVIVIQLFTAIEEAFNDIWGVRRGRSWLVRVGMYWTVISLGAVLAIALVALAAAQAYRFTSFARDYAGDGFAQWVLLYGARFGTYALIAAVIAAFYKFIPNTRVTWLASFAGAAFATLSLAVNNALAFFYVERVAMQSALYGSVGIIPVLMIGLFVFWIFLLVGGRVTYAVQNARFRSSMIAWEELSVAAQQSIALLVFAHIGRHFRACRPPLSIDQLAERTGLPLQIINASVTRLGDVGLVTSIPPGEGDSYQAYKYQPAMPLDRLGLLEFKERMESGGDTQGIDLSQLEAADPVARRYHRLLEQARSAFGGLSMEEALQETEAEEQEAPGARESSPSPASGPSQTERRRAATGGRGD